MDYAMPSVRCFTCGRVVCPQIERCVRLVGEGVALDEALNRVGFPRERECCRRMAMGSFVVEPTPREPKNIAGYCEFLSTEGQTHRVVPTK